MAYAAETNPEATGKAMARAVEVNAIAIGQALITALKTKAEPIAEAVLVAARINAGEIQIALSTGPAKDPEAAEILARVLPAISWVPQIPTQTGPDPAGDGMVFEAILVAPGGEPLDRSPIKRVLVKFPADRPKPVIQVQVVPEPPTEVPRLSAERIVSDFVEITAENFTGGDLIVAQVTLSVEKSWLKENQIHEWSIEFSRFDEAQGVWKPALANRVREDEAQIFYSLVVTDFSLWSISGSTEPPPVIFQVDDLRIAPARLNEGEAVTIGATVTNLLSEQAEYIAVLWLNAGLNSSQTLVLEANESADVDFLIRPKKGEYEARIDALVGNFIVVIPGEGLGLILWIIIISTAVMLAGGFWWFIIAWRRRRRRDDRTRLLELAYLPGRIIRWFFLLFGFSRRRSRRRV